MCDPASGLECRTPPARSRYESHREVGSGATEADRIEGALVERVGSGLQPLGVCAPRRDRVGLVQSRRGGHCLPEPVDVRLAEHLRRPARIGRGDDHPVDVPPADIVGHRSPDLAWIGAADERGIEVLHELGSRVARERDDRRVLRRPPLEPVEKIRRGPPDLGLRPELDGRTAYVQIGVEDDHVLSAGAIRLTRHRSGDLGVLDEARHDDVLTRLHVSADADGEFRVPAESLRGRHELGFH